MSNIKTKISNFKIPHLKKLGEFAYGTSGYRSTPDLLPIGRVSLVAYMRSSTLAGKYIGFLITASHNPAQDNGIKLIDHMGEMFDSTWETIADKIVNCPNKDLFSELNKIHRTHGNYRQFGVGPRANIIIGRDSRESGKILTEQVKEVLSHLNCQVHDYKEVSTPQFHWLVNQSNQNSEIIKKEKYLENFINFTKFTNLEKSIRVDTSNGVVKNICEELNEEFDKLGMTFSAKDDVKRTKTPFFIITNPPGPVNYLCGAQAVMYENTIPLHLKDETGEFIGFDGDADRMIYFELNKTEENEKPQTTVEFIDGDRQASIIVQLMLKLTKSLELNVKVGCVLSDYSNLAAIKFCGDLCDTVRGRTGIKNLIKAAREYDIGVYNEPNGHGGAIFSSRLVQMLEQILSSEKGTYSDDKIEKAQLLNQIVQIYDSSHADPMCNFFLLEYIKMAEPKLFEPSYTPLPCRQMVVRVRDRTILVLDKNLNISAPIPLKTLVDKIKKTENARVFVRASGTEPIIRIFCEAESEVDLLCLTVAQGVYNICDGIGPHPEISFY